MAKYFIIIKKNFNFHFINFHHITSINQSLLLMLIIVINVLLLGVSSPLSGRRWSCSAAPVTRNGCQEFWILWDPGDWRSSTPNVFQSNTWWSTGCAVKLSSFWGGRGVGLPPPGTGVSLILGGALAPRLGCRARGVARGGLKQKIVMSAQSNGEVFQKNIIL